jgi:ABC-type dipeptide/oligopeptide/nickel transport system permease component
MIGVGAGIISAVKQYSFSDVFVTLSTSVLVSVPVFWLGMLFQIFFGIKLKEWTNGAIYLPISGMSSAQFPDWAHMILPAITLASVSTAYVARIMRSQMLEAGGQDYIRTAEAKGLTRRAVIFRHQMKNALIPVVTFIGIDFGVMMGGAILTETVFSWPGVGREIFLAVGQRDWPIVMGGVIIIVFLVMIINLLVDLSYAWLDPRIRYGGAAEVTEERHYPTTIGSMARPTSGATRSGPRRRRFPCCPATLTPTIPRGRRAVRSGATRGAGSAGTSSRSSVSCGSS